MKESVERFRYLILLAWRNHGIVEFDEATLTMLAQYAAEIVAAEILATQCDATPVSWSAASRRDGQSKEA